MCVCVGVCVCVCVCVCRCVRVCVCRCVRVCRLWIVKRGLRVCESYRVSFSFRDAFTVAVLPGGHP